MTWKLISICMSKFGFRFTGMYKLCVPMHAHLMVLMNMSGNDSLENLPPKNVQCRKSNKMQYFCSLEITGVFFSLHYLSLTNSSRVIISIFLFLSWGTGRGIGVYAVGGSPCGWRIYSLPKNWLWWITAICDPSYRWVLINYW